MLFIGLYLLAIVAANLLVTELGPEFSILLAGLFIGPNLTIRDALHEKWQGENLWRNMALLIGTGSILSALLNVNATPIAIASFLAFAGAAIADTAVYQRMFKQSRIAKMNVSNFASAAVDSILFPAFAFGFPLLIPIMFGQFAAKVIGGAVWSFILTLDDKKIGVWLCNHNIHDLDLGKEEAFGSGNVAPCKRCGGTYVSYNPYF